MTTVIVQWQPLPPFPLPCLEMAHMTCSESTSIYPINQNKLGNSQKKKKKKSQEADILNVCVYTQDLAFTFNFFFYTPSTIMQITFIWLAQAISWPGLYSAEE